MLSVCQLHPKEWDFIVYWLGTCMGQWDRTASDVDRRAPWYVNKK